MIRKTEPHQKCSSRNPASTGPAAIPTPADVEKIPIAAARAGPVNVHIRMAIMAGVISALPTPIAARAAISWPASLAYAAHSEDPAKITNPLENTVR
ncbi:hypothetical protein GCM10010252_25960 [Streptomyces aureoverticillatus]|nr:hypothetical protein GCM10010252_25960 [Streptomyces aureoverticillatus]